MPPREWRLRIEDTLEAAGRIARCVEGKDLAAFEADDLTRDAVSRCFGIIGEAVKGVPSEIVAAHPEIPWDEMRAMRNVVRARVLRRDRRDPLEDGARGPADAGRASAKAARGPIARVSASTTGGGG